MTPLLKFFLVLVLNLIIVPGLLFLLLMMFTHEKRWFIVNSRQTIEFWLMVGLSVFVCMTCLRWLLLSLRALFK